MSTLIRVGLGRNPPFSCALSYNSETTGPQSEVEVVWTTPFDDTQLFDPVVTDRVYLAEEKGNGTAYALDRRDGSVTWTRDQGLAGLRCPATISEDRVLAISDEQLQALDSSSGTTTWEASVSPSGAGALTFAPTVTDDRTFIPTNTGVIALDSDTGEKDWTKKLSEENHSPQLWTTPSARGDFVYTFDRGESEKELSVHALDRDSGDQQWTTPIEAPDEGWNLTNHVIAGEDHLFVTLRGPTEGLLVRGGDDSSSQLAAGRLAVLEPESGEIRWTYEFDGPIGPSALGHETLYVAIYDSPNDDSRVHAMDLNEQRPDWTQTLDVGMGLVSATDKTVYVAGADGIQALAASDGSHLWQRFADQYAGTPIIAGDTVYARISESGGENTRIAAIHER